jgi:hypothetical protein
MFEFVRIRTANLRFGGVRTRTGACTEHAAAKKDEVRYPVGRFILSMFKSRISTIVYIGYLGPIQKATIVSGVYKCCFSCYFML